MQESYQRVKQKPACRGRGGSWEETTTADSPGDRQNLQHKYLQQKTEKFHLLRGPDAINKIRDRKETDRWKKAM